MVRARELASLDGPDLLRRGAAAARVGESDEALAYLTELTRREPDNAEAWLWLAGVAPGPRAKRESFERVLSLRPDDPDALAGLARLADKYGRGVLADDADDVTTLRCTWHPERETLLRCNRCDRPMCTTCAVKHPVGLRCKECTRELRSPLYKIGPRGYAGAAAVALVVGTLAAIPAALLAGFLWIVALLFGVAAGTAIGELVSKAAGRKRGPALWIIAAAGMVVGVAIVGVILERSPGGAVRLFLNLGVWIYLLVGIASTGTRLR